MLLLSLTTSSQTKHMDSVDCVRTINMYNMCWTFITFMKINTNLLQFIKPQWKSWQSNASLLKFKIETNQCNLCKSMQINENRLQSMNNIKIL